MEDEDDDGVSAEDEEDAKLGLELPAREESLLGSFFLMRLSLSSTDCKMVGSFEPLAASLTAAGEGRTLKRSASATRFEVNLKSAPGAAGGGGGGKCGGSFGVAGVTWTGGGGGGGGRNPGGAAEAFDGGGRGACW